MDGDVDMAHGGPPPSTSASAAAATPARRVADNEELAWGPADPFDWEAYIAAYAPQARIDRLLRIARVCPDLRVPVAKEATNLIREHTLDVHAFQAALALQHQGSQSAQTERDDKEWISRTEVKARQEAEKLDLELRNYQNNLIKESIRVSARAAGGDSIRASPLRAHSPSSSADILTFSSSSPLNVNPQMANRDLADHFRRCGDLTGALRCYQRTRDFCSTSEHVVEMCLSVIEVSIAFMTVFILPHQPFTEASMYAYNHAPQVSLQLHNYSTVATFVSKAEGVLESYNPSASVGSSGRSGGTSSGSLGPPSKGATTSGADAIGALFRAGGSSSSGVSAGTVRGGAGAMGSGDAAQARLKREVAQIQAKLHMANGLASLGLGRYEAAARSFLRIESQYAETFSNTISAGDVALYGTLCALAVFPRPTLKSQVLDRAGFKTLMEHEPHVRELLDAFWACDYKKGLGLLAKHKVSAGVSASVVMPRSSHCPPTICTFFLPLFPCTDTPRPRHLSAPSHRRADAPHCQALPLSVPRTIPMRHAVPPRERVRMGRQSYRG